MKEQARVVVSEKRIAFESSFSSHSRHRDRSTIIEDILRTISDRKKGRKKTQIMQSANLSYALAKKYLSCLVESGFISMTEKRAYQITQKGSVFLHLIETERIPHRS